MRPLVALTLLLSATAVQSQQARQPTAPPPINWPSPPLPDGPIVLDTGIQHQIRLTVTKGLNQPWSMAFLPDGGILVTERPGRLRIVRKGVLDPKPVAGVPKVQAQGLAGLMDLALHPRFAENKLIYFTYHKPPDGERRQSSRWRAGDGTGRRWPTCAISSPPFRTAMRRGLFSAKTA